jgi:hypothetical protein
MFSVHAKDMTELMAQAVRAHIECPKPDAVLNIETHLYDSVLTADSCTYNLDVGRELWLNKGRWSRLMKEYVPRDSLNMFVTQSQEIMTGASRPGATTNLMFHEPKRFDKKHRWGGCLMGATFRGNNGKAGRATLTFYSRTTYMGYMAFLDAAIASRIAALIQSPDNISFRWYISSQQLHCFKTLPYVYSQPDLYKKIEDLARQKRLATNMPTPTWYHMSKWYRKVMEDWQRWRYKENTNGDGIEANEFAANNMLNNEKYGPFKRIKRRWLEHKRYLTKLVPPSLPLISLNFSRCVDRGQPTGGIVRVTKEKETPS